MHDQRNWEYKYENVSNEVQSANNENKFSISKTIHGDSDIPSLVFDVAEADNAEKGDPVVDGAVGKESIYDVA